MIPLAMANVGEETIIHKIKGKDETCRFLANMGFVVGGTATVVAEIEGSLIVNVKEARVALGKEMAMHIMVETN